VPDSARDEGDDPSSRRVRESSIPSAARRGMSHLASGRAGEIITRVDWRRLMPLRRFGPRSRWFRMTGTNSIRVPREKTPRRVSTNQGARTSPRRSDPRSRFRPCGERRRG
jgi:hypothetical protein